MEETDGVVVEKISATSVLERSTIDCNMGIHAYMTVPEAASPPAARL
jgi:hypothetical protein